MSSIPKSESYKALLATRPVSRTRRLQLFVIPNPGLGQRLGVMVPKRWAKRAVDRNLLKRLFRHAHHGFGPLLPSDSDTLIRLVSPVKAVGNADRTMWWDEIRQLFSRYPRP